MEWEASSEALHIGIIAWIQQALEFLRNGRDTEINGRVFFLLDSFIFQVEETKKKSVGISCACNSTIR